MAKDFFRHFFFIAKFLKDLINDEEEKKRHIKILRMCIFQRKMPFYNKCTKSVHSEFEFWHRLCSYMRHKTIQAQSDLDFRR